MLYLLRKEPGGGVLPYIDIRGRSPYVGGFFGQKNLCMWVHIPQKICVGGYIFPKKSVLVGPNSPKICVGGSNFHFCSWNRWKLMEVGSLWLDPSCLRRVENLCRWVLFLYPNCTPPSFLRWVPPRVSPTGLCCKHDWLSNRKTYYMLYLRPDAFFFFRRHFRQLYFKSFFNHGEEIVVINAKLRPF